MSIHSQPIPCRDTALHSHLSHDYTPPSSALQKIHLSAPPPNPFTPRSDGTYPERGTSSRATITASAMAPQRGGSTVSCERRHLSRPQRCPCTVHRFPSTPGICCPPLPPGRSRRPSETLPSLGGIPPSRAAPIPTREGAHWPLAALRTPEKERLRDQPEHTTHLSLFPPDQQLCSAEISPPPAAALTPQPIRQAATRPPGISRWRRLLLPDNPGRTADHEAATTPGQRRTPRPRCPAPAAPRLPPQRQAARSSSGGRKITTRDRESITPANTQGTPQPRVPEGAGALPAPSHGGSAVPAPHRWCEVTGKLWRRGRRASAPRGLRGPLGGGGRRSPSPLPLPHGGAAAARPEPPAGPHVRARPGPARCEGRRHHVPGAVVTQHFYPRRPARPRPTGPDRTEREPGRSRAEPPLPPRSSGNARPPPLPGSDPPPRPRPLRAAPGRLLTCVPAGAPRGGGGGGGGGGAGAAAGALRGSLLPPCQRVPRTTTSAGRPPPPRRAADQPAPPPLPAWRVTARVTARPGPPAASPRDRPRRSFMGEGAGRAGRRPLPAPVDL
ncbi:formin-2-like [Agelaius tricolor]|uniref:formin-2-like n=1 Tax=Agelaius tricolor TaxID=9191 RepID=UPI0039F223E7